MQYKVSDKKNSRIIGMIFWVLCLSMVVISAFLPDMGEKILKYKFVKSISMTLLGILLVTPIVSRFLQEESETTINGRPRQESLEEMVENKTGHTSIKTLIILVLGSILIFAGGKTLIACIKDVSNGPVWITLESTRVESGSGSDTQSSGGNYNLFGLANGLEYTFRLEGTEMYENLMRKINYQVPEIIVVYYPESKAIIQMQIFFENNEKVVLPEGDRAYDSRSLEKIPEGKGETIEDMSRYEETDETNAGAPYTTPTPMPGTYKPATSSYSEVALADLNLPEITMGADYLEVARELENLPEEDAYKMVSVYSDTEVYMEHLKRVVMVMEAYSLSEEQYCDILYKEDIELILVFHKETRAIEAVYARRLN